MRPTSVMGRNYSPCPCRHACYHAGMSQVTWRAPDELVDRVRAAAAREQRSMNDFLTTVLDAATNPELAGDHAARIRERLAAAGLLVPSGPTRRRPDPARLEIARRKAGRGTPLAEIVAGDR